MNIIQIIILCIVFYVIFWRLNDLQSRLDNVYKILKILSKRTANHTVELYELERKENENDDD